MALRKDFENLLSVAFLTTAVRSRGTFRGWSAKICSTTNASRPDSLPHDPSTHESTCSGSDLRAILCGKSAESRSRLPENEVSRSSICRAHCPLGTRRQTPPPQLRREYQVFSLLSVHGLILSVPLNHGFWFCCSDGSCT